MVAFAIVGCGNNPHPPPLKTEREDGSPWLVRYGAMNEEARSLDPQVAYDQMSRTILKPVYDTLLEYHPMKTEPYEVVPALLETMPERTVNADGSLTYLCRLKKGVMFQDDPCFPHGKGRELVAQDVHYAWQRMCDPKVECPVLSTFQASVAGMTEAYEAAKANGGVFDYSKPLKGLEVVDSHTFKIHLMKPYPQLLYWMAMHFTTPVAREAVEYYDGKEHPDGPKGAMRLRPEFKWHPVSTGPYRIHDHKPNSGYRLVRNPNYTATTFPTEGWPADKEALLRPLAGKKLPLIDEVQLPIIREQLPAFLLTRQGYLDRGAVGKDAFDSVVTASLDLAPQYKERGIALEKDVTVSTFYISMNTQDPILGPNKKLRQALSASFNARGWVDIFYNGVAEVAQQLLSPGIYGFQEDFKNPYGYNLEKAKQLMVEAGYPNGIDSKRAGRLSSRSTRWRGIPGSARRSSSISAAWSSWESRCAWWRTPSRACWRKRTRGITRWPPAQAGARIIRTRRTTTSSFTARTSRPPGRTSPSSRTTNSIASSSKWRRWRIAPSG